MKRIFALLISFLIFFSSLITAFASEEVSFSCGDVSCNNNRLFSVDVKAKSSDPISAATFEFTYDKTLIEFRGVTAVDGSSVRANELDNCIKAVYLCTDGKNIENETTIFTLEFKSLNLGSCSINYTVSECVDSNVEFMPVGNCIAGHVDVVSTAVNLDSSSKKSDKTPDDNANNYSGKTSDDKTETEPVTYDEFGFLNNDISDNNSLMFTVGIISGVLIVSLVVIAFVVGKRFAEKKNNQKPDN